MTLTSLATGEQTLLHSFCAKTHPSLSCLGSLQTGRVLPKRTSHPICKHGPFTIEEAQEWAEMTVRALPEGTLFTSARLLGTIKLRSDKRGRGAVIRHLQRLGLVTPDGFTTEDQEGRNNGYAVKWRVARW